MRTYQSFQESVLGYLFRKDDEDEYIENHPSTYVKHLSLGTLLMISAAQAKLFFVLVHLENMLHN